ncbi:MAG TPA: hypothetical protein DCY76_04395 [Flavobacteriales bacterium]|nr:hypothetical protein [Flavobacteriales bacterium]
MASSLRNCHIPSKHGWQCQSWAVGIRRCFTSVHPVWFLK